jgi:hypothetical protein
MTQQATDSVEWRGELTLLNYTAGGWARRDEPLRMMRYQVHRRYRLPADGASGA